MTKNVQRRWREKRDGLRSFIDCVKQLNPNLDKDVTRQLAQALEEASSFLLAECLLSLSGDSITLSHFDTIIFDDRELKEYLGLCDVFKQFSDDVDSAFSSHFATKGLYHDTSHLLNQLKPALRQVSQRVQQEGLVLYSLLGDATSLFPSDSRPVLKSISDIFNSLPSIKIQAFSQFFESAIVDEMQKDIIELKSHNTCDFITSLRLIVIQYLMLLRALSSPRHCIQRVLQSAISGQGSEASLKIQGAITEICQAFDETQPLLHQDNMVYMQLGLIYRDAAVWESILGLDLGIKFLIDSCKLVNFRAGKISYTSL